MEKISNDPILNEICEEHFKDYFKKKDGTFMQGEEITSDMMAGMLCEITAYIAGYKKAKEIYSFSADDIIEFAEWVYRIQFNIEGDTQDKETKELLQIWLDNKSKTIS